MTHRLYGPERLMRQHQRNQDERLLRLQRSLVVGECRSGDTSRFRQYLYGLSEEERSSLGILEQEYEALVDATNPK